MENNRKLRILFVDDEPSILKFIPHLLGKFKNEWDIKTATSASKGFELLADSPFEVVVSDLNMPGVGGVEFLKQVKEHCPSAARIIFSSYSDRQTVQNCVGVIHQFLPKPFEKELLIATIQRAAMLQSLLPDTEIKETVSKMKCIPSIPTLYAELLRQLNSPATEIEDIAKTVSQDIGMTAQILKMVNSAFYGLDQPISSISEAINHIGIETVKYMALTLGVFSQFESSKLGGLSVETLWKHSQRTASAAKLITKSAGASRQITEDAVAAGMLHDLGKLVMASNFPEQYENVGRAAQALKIEWLVAERETFGFDHAEVGGYLLGLWGLPLPVVDAVAFHHFPSRRDQSAFTALTAVHAANVLVQTQRPSYGGIASPQIDFMYLSKTGRPDALEQWRTDLEESPSI